MSSHPNLDRLNTLLRQTRLGLPPFRAQVDPSGRNLKWLKKVVPGNEACTTELREMLEMPLVQLLQNVPDKEYASA